MKKLWHTFIHILKHLAVIVCLILFWSLAFLITEFIYSLIGMHPHPFFSQIINSLLGFILFGFTIFFITRLFKPEKKRMEFLKTLNDALLQISKGDFNVHVVLPKKENENWLNHPLFEFAENIRHMAKELGEMEKMRQEFVSNVSHEIQSPLTSISGFARALQNENLSWEERLHYLGIIEAESKRLSNLSDNLLKLTSLESEHHPFEAKSYRLDKQLRSIVLSCEPQWANKEIEMDTLLDKMMITADEDLMSQVWMNLINNAIKFTPNKGTIGIRFKENNNEVAVSISDTGIGMTEEEQLHIFERFYKADKSRNRALGGNGLGLSIVKKIINMHHGSIKVESQTGKGTTFSVTLPLNNVERAVSN